MIFIITFVINHPQLITINLKMRKIHTLVQRKVDGKRVLPLATGKTKKNSLSLEATFQPSEGVDDHQLETRWQFGRQCGLKKVFSSTDLIFNFKGSLYIYTISSHK